MKGFDVKDTRTFSVVGHSHTGKTLLVDAMLFISQANDRLGRLVNGSSVVDTDSEEKKRNITISSKTLNCEWKKTNFFILNTPGYTDFFGDTSSSIWVSDSCVVLIDAVSGVEVSTVKMWDFMQRIDKPRVFFINKMDKENASFYKTVDSIREYFGDKCIPIMLPVGKQVDFKAVVDILSIDKADSLDDEGKQYYEANKNRITDAIAETDDALLEKYLGGQSLSSDELVSGLKKGIAAGKIFPILCGSVEKNIGVSELMDRIVSLMPSPVDAAKIFLLKKERLSL